MWKNLSDKKILNDSRNTKQIHAKVYFIRDISVIYQGHFELHDNTQVCVSNQSCASWSKAYKIFTRPIFKLCYWRYSCRNRHIYGCI